MGVGQQRLMSGCVVQWWEGAGRQLIVADD